MGKTTEKLGISKNQIRYNLDKIEYLMLTKFYSFVIKNRDKYWIHWNMTDDNYGFQAIEHRYQCLEFKLYKKRSKSIRKSITIDKFRKVDLSDLLIRRYGYNYINHPRLENLIIKNGLSLKNFLTGSQEAKCFENQEYDEILRSSLTKIKLLSKLLDLAIDNELKILNKDTYIGNCWLSKCISVVQFFKCINIENCIL